MSMKVEVDAVDAEMIAMLRKYKASRVMSWDVTLLPGVTMKIDIDHPLTYSVPSEIVAAVTACIADSIAVLSLKSALTQPDGGGT